MDTQSILQQIAKLAQQQQQRGATAEEELNFAKRLRDERLGSVQKFQEHQEGKFTNETTIPDNPIERFDRGQAFLQAGRGVIDPINDRIESAQRTIDNSTTQQTNLLQTLLEQANKSSTGNPIQEVMRQNGGDLLTASTQAEREAQARNILAAGGVLEYRKQVPVDQLLTDKEKQAREAAFQLMKTAGDIVGATEGKNADALGGFQRFLPDSIISNEGVINRANVAEITSQKMKEISGAAISEQEVKRLAEFLPRKNDREDVIEAKSKRIFNALKIGLDMQVLAKQNGLTLDEAYMKYGAEIYPKYGEEVPAWIGKSVEKDSFNPDSLLDDLGF